MYTEISCWSTQREETQLPNIHISSLSCRTGYPTTGTTGCRIQRVIRASSAFSTVLPSRHAETPTDILLIGIRCNRKTPRPDSALSGSVFPLVYLSLSLSLSPSLSLYIYISLSLSLSFSLALSLPADEIFYGRAQGAYFALLLVLSLSASESERGCHMDMDKREKEHPMNRTSLNGLIHFSGPGQKKPIHVNKFWGPGTGEG